MHAARPERDRRCVAEHHATRLATLTLAWLLAACGDDQPAGSPDAAPADATATLATTDTAAESQPANEPASPADEPASPAEPAGLPEIGDWTQAEGHLGLHTLAWRPIDHDGVPRNVEFSLDVVLLKGGEPAPGAILQVTGYMPEHSHGLVQLPRAEELGGGRYRIDGLILHMRGFWQLRFTVVDGRSVETVSFEMQL